jgi:hypothetical protein
MAAVAGPPEPQGDIATIARMTTRARIAVLLVLVAGLALATVAPARADEAFDKVAAVYAQSGGQLDPCAFTQQELEAAIRGIPPQIRNVVPDIRRAMVEGIAAHMRGDCRDGGADEGRTGGAAVPPAGATPTTTAPPVTTSPAPDAATTTTPAPADTTAAPPPTATTPGAEPAAPPPAAATTDDERDLAPLWIALVAAGALLLLALLLWGVARMRGWDPSWVARTRHAWGEAGFRTTSTWSEFTDWLRLGR